MSDARIATVFLSATVVDIDDYRQEVQAAVRGLDITLHLQEEWPYGAADVVALCKRHLEEESDAYIGIFGFRYGWVPEDQANSITRLECEWAFRRWPRDHACPVFIFLPEPGSAAERELLERAERALRQEFPDQPRKQEQSKQLQRDFLEWLASQHRRYQYYDDVAELREKAICSIYHWNTKILENAIDGRRQDVSDDIPWDELGRIDRKEQTGAIEQALYNLDNSPDAAAMCLVVHGDETMGQFAYMRFLERWEGWESDGSIHLINGLQSDFDARALAAAALDALDRGLADEGHIFACLAREIRHRSAEERQVFILPDVGQMQGGIDSLARDFWIPLLQAFSDLGLEPPAFRSVLLTCRSSRLSTPLPDFIVPADQASQDFQKLRALPALEPFTGKHVDQWLKELPGRKFKPQQRKPLVDTVTAKDGIPQRVYDRLRISGFWHNLAGD